MTELAARVRRLAVPTGMPRVARAKPIMFTVLSCLLPALALATVPGDAVRTPAAMPGARPTSAILQGGLYVEKSTGKAYSGLISKFYGGSGTVRILMQIEKGRVSGRVVEFHPDGTVWKTRSIVDGQPQGPFSVHYPDGTLRESGEFRAGALHGVYRTFHPNGQPEKELTFVLGLADGPARQWHPDGRELWRGVYRAGIGHGTFMRFGPDGRPATEKRYDNGFLREFKRFE